MASIYLEGESLQMVEELATCAQDGSTEMGMSCTHPGGLELVVYAQTVAAKPRTKAGKLEAHSAGAHKQIVAVERDPPLDKLDALDEASRV